MQMQPLYLWAMLWQTLVVAVSCLMLSDSLSTAGGVGESERQVPASLTGQRMRAEMLVGNAGAWAGVCDWRGRLRAAGRGRG